MIKFPHIFIYPMGAGGIFIRTCLRYMLGHTLGYRADPTTNEYFCGANINQHLTSKNENVIIWNERWWNEYEQGSMSEEVTLDFARTVPDTSLGNIAMHCPPKIYDSIDYKTNTGLLLEATDERINWCANLAIFKRADTTVENFRYDYLEQRKQLTNEWHKAANPVVIKFDDFFLNQNIEYLEEYCERRKWKTEFDKTELKNRIKTYYNTNLEKVEFVN